MRRMHIIGGQNHGKTRLIAELIAEFRSRGLRIGTIKHTHHVHELDTPGKDSYTHRTAGAAVVGILSGSLNAVFWPTQTIDPAQDPDARYESFAPIFADCDLVLVEGDAGTRAPKLEVWRAVLGTALLADRVDNVRAVVTDDPVRCSVTVVPRSDIAAIADLILRG